jgi:hypothetical protein
MTALSVPLSRRSYNPGVAMRHGYEPTPGEFLTGVELDTRGYEVWLPAKDRGIDLLAEQEGRFLRLQVKESRTYPSGNPVAGWSSWSQLTSDQLLRAVALNVDFFVFVVHAPDESGRRLKFAPFFVVVPPRILDARLGAYRPGVDRTVYWCRDEDMKLWDLRGKDQRTAGLSFKTPERDFTEYLNACNLLGGGGPQRVPPGQRTNRP